MSPTKGTDARVSTSPSLYVQNVIQGSDTHLYHHIKDRIKDGCPPSKVADARQAANQSR